MAAEDIHANIHANIDVKLCINVIKEVGVRAMGVGATVLEVAGNDADIHVLIDVKDTTKVGHLAVVHFQLHRNKVAEKEE